MFFSLNYFAFSFTLIRHSIALAGVIFSYKFLKERKPIQFIILVFIAGLFHRTAWIFIIAYPLVNIKFSYLNMVLIAFSLVFSVTIGPAMLKLAIRLIGSSHFNMYLDPQKNTITFFAINLVILGFVMIFNKNYIKTKEGNILANLLTLGTACASCMLFFSEAFRISTFFTMFSIIFLPNAISEMEDKQNKRLFILGFYCIFCAYFFAFTMHNNSIYPYEIGKLIERL